MDCSAHTKWKKKEEKVLALLAELQQRPDKKPLPLTRKPAMIIAAHIRGDLTLGEAITELRKWSRDQRPKCKPGIVKMRSAYVRTDIDNKKEQV